jgi:hypothetical protein
MRRNTMKARGWRRGGLLGLVLAVALVAAGCGGDEERRRPRAAARPSWRA